MRGRFQETSTERRGIDRLDCFADVLCRDLSSIGLLYRLSKPLMDFSSLRESIARGRTTENVIIIAKVAISAAI